MIRTCLLWGFCLLGLCGALAAQDMGCTPDGRWTYRHYHARNSLVRNSVHRIARDRDGFFWMATQDGLLQFDGKQFVHHITSTVEGFYSGRISGILSLGPDTLLVASHFTNFSSCLIVNNRVIPDPGNLARKKYFFNHRSQLFSRTARIASVLEAFDWQINGLIWTKAAPPTLYTQVKGDGFRVFPSNGRPSVMLRYKDAFRALHRAFTTDSLLYIVRENKPWRAARYRNELLLGETPIHFDFPPDHDTLLHVSWSMHSPELILVFSRSLYHLRLNADGSLHATRLCSGLDFNGVASTWYDETTGLLLVGFTHEGLYVLQRNGLAFQQSPSRRAVFYNVFDLGNGQLAALSYEGWFLSRAGERTMPRRVPLHGHVMDPRIGYQDRQGRLWTVMFDNQSQSLHLAVFQPNDLENPRMVMPADPYPLTLSEDTDGGFWVIGQRKVSRLTPDLKVVPVIFDPPWRRKPLFCVTRASDGVLWVGAEGGVYRYRPLTGACDSLPGLGQVAARGISFDRSGNAWIASYGQGFFAVVGNRVVPIPGDRHGYLKFSHAFATDSKNNFWITTNNGMFVTPWANLLRFVEGKGPAPDYHYVDLSAFPASEFNGGARQPILQLPDGRVVACNVRGLVSFYPDSIPILFPDKPLVLLRAYTGQEELRLEHPVSLPPDFGRIAFVLAAASNGPVQNVQISYRLVGFDEDWKPYTYGDAITYTALPAGTYQLEGRILRGFGGQYEICQLGTIRVLPYWYQTWWANLLFVAGLALLVYLIVRWRFRRVRWLNAELNRLVAARTEELEQTVARLHLSEASLRTAMETRDRIISIISHDMKTPLLFMSRVSGEMLRTTHDLREKDLLEYLKQVTATTTELHQWLNTLLSWIRSEGNLSIKPEKVMLEDLIGEVLGIYRQAAMSKGIELVAVIPADSWVVGDRNWLKVMLSNLVENSVKFSTGGVIRIAAETVGQNKVIQLSDQGRGISEQRVIAMQGEQIAVAGKGTAGERGLGLGLQIVAKIVALHFGNWEITSAPDKGTVVTLCLPYRESL